MAMANVLPARRGALLAQRNLQRTLTTLSSSLKMAPLEKEELDFAWQDLGDGGIITAERLQSFMLEVADEDITQQEANDLLDYMNADGTYGVGREDFNYFMSTGSLKDTEVKSFMWAPRQKYRKEHAYKVSEAESSHESTAAPARHVHHSDEVEVKTTDTPAETDERTSKRGSVHQTPRAANKASQSSKQGMHAVAEDQAQEHPHTTGPRPKLQKQRSRHSTADHIHTADQHQISGTDSHRTSGRSKRHHADAPAEAALVQETDQASKANTVKKSTSKANFHDKKVLAKIETALEHYEEASWDRFLQDEMEFERKMFKQFAKEEEVMTWSEYHKLNEKWHKRAAWRFPTRTVSPNDTIATLEYFTSKEHSRVMSAPPGFNRRNSDRGSSIAATVASSPRMHANFLKMSYKMWDNVLRGSYRPTDHVAQELRRPFSPR